MMNQEKRFCVTVMFCASLLTTNQSPVTAFAGQLPSLFRGVVVANSPAGVRIVSVEETSQASLADLRSEDIIVQINDTPVRSIDEFAVLSHALKGHTTTATVVVFRHGQPLEVVLHLYSFPLLRHWDLLFIPEHDVRFADPQAGLGYWVRLGRGFEIEGLLEQALNAYLNALHNEPTQLEVALKACDLLWQIAQHRLAHQQMSEAVAALQHGTLLLKRLFDHPLNEAELQLIRQRLEETVKLLQTHLKQNG